MKKTNALIIILTVIVVLLVANFIVSRHPLRLDLTKNSIYTLSSSTRDILKNLDDVVTIRAYFTENLPPALAPLRRDVDDILSEFKGAAGTRIQVEFIDPSTSAGEEQKLAMMGIPPVQLNVVEKDKQEVAKVYLGMVVLFGGKQEVIPVIGRVDNLEYDLVQAILKVSTKEVPKVAWWEPESIPEGDGFAGIKKSIGRRYDVVSITPKNYNDIVEKKFAALVLATPRTLSPDEIFAIDQYIMNGGHVIALIDRFAIAGNLTTSPIESEVFNMIVGYGVTVEDKIVMDRSNAMAAFSGGVVTYHMPYPFWPDVRRGQYDKEDPIVAELESTVLPWTSPLVMGSKEGVQIEEVAKTTQYAVATGLKDVRLDPQSAGETMLSGEKKTYPLIAKISGSIESYYKGNAAKVPKGREIKEKADDGAMLLITGTSRWVSDRVLGTFPQNAALFENALDAFAMGNVLIGIRSRENNSRPLEVLSDGVRAAIKYMNIAIGPVIVVVIGLILFMIRRARRRAIKFV